MGHPCPHLGSFEPNKYYPMQRVRDKRKEGGKKLNKIKTKGERGLRKWQDIIWVFHVETCHITRTGNLTPNAAIYPP